MDMIKNKIHLHESCFPPHQKDFKAKYLILHDIKFNIDQSIEVFRKHKLSSHYYVSSDGQIYEFANDRAAYHAGSDSSFRNDINLNNSSIGIEVQSDWEYDMPQVQYGALQGLIKEIMLKWNICHNILSHAEIAPYRLSEDASFTYGKTDPGLTFPWKKFAQDNIGKYHDVEISLKPEIIFRVGEKDSKIKDVQIALHDYGYNMTPINGIYDTRTAAVLNAFYLRYYPEWFGINQKLIRRTIIEALEKANIQNVKGDVDNIDAISLSELESGSINDKWLFEHLYHLPASNIDTNALQIIKQIFV